MKFKELKLKPAEELEKLLAENREKLRDFRFKVALKEIKNVRSIRAVKKEVAKIMTLLKK